MPQSNISYSSVETQRQLRIDRMEKLKGSGQNPFSSVSKRDYTLDEVRQNFSQIQKNESVTLAGRIKSKRMSGKIAFGTIEDESLPTGFQFIFKKDELPEPGNPDQKLTFEDYKELFDEGDYIQATGHLDHSQRGEPSLFVTEYTILTKALRPLPESLEYDNFEERYTNRVVDYKMNTKDENELGIREMMKLKSRYWAIWREEMIKEGFTEVECPIFESVPGGADARPFTTYYNELDQEMYLRISLELPLKKLIAGGFEKVFEIGRIFRNEGASPSHLQEYTQIEWYWCYKDYYDGMKFTAKIYRRIALEMIGKLTQTDYHGNQINWGEWCSQEEADKNGWKLIEGWPAIPYFEAIRYYSGGKVDLEDKTYNELLAIAKENKIEIETGTGYANLMDKIYKKVARPFMINPIFLIQQPVEIEPLAKKDPENPKFVHRFQPVVGGAELGKGFTELNDPIDQFERFKEQQRARDAGDEEAQFMDEEYVKAMELGMPPLAGFGISERLFSFLLGKNIKECVTFPAVRTEEVQSKKKTMVAHSIILDTPEIPSWTKLNTAAHLSASFAARSGKTLIHTEQNTTKDGEVIPMNIRHAIIIKKTDDKFKLLDLKRKAEKKGLKVAVFTEEMMNSTNDNIVSEKQESKNSSQIGYLGVLVFGKKGDVEKLTDNFEMVE